MPAYNQTILLGNVGNDWELRYSPSGVACANNTIAVNRKFKGADGETKESLLWMKLSAFGKDAETLQQYNKKGDPLFVSGRLEDDSWTDKESGQKRNSIKLVLERFQFISTKPADESGDEREDAPPPRKTTTKPPAKQGGKTCTHDYSEGSDPDWNIP